MDSFKGELFLQVVESIQKQGLPFRFPPSLFNFVTLDDVKQEFYEGVSGRLNKVKKYEQGTGTSPEVGFLIDGGVKRVQSFIRSTCAKNLYPHCACKTWVSRVTVKCQKCGKEVVFAEIVTPLTEFYEQTLFNNGIFAIEARLTLEQFTKYLRKCKSKRPYEMFKILTGNDLGPCDVCDKTCKGAISMFEFKNKKWQSGCINMRVKIAKYWGMSVNRVSSVYIQLKTLAKDYAGSVPAF